MRLKKGGTTANCKITCDCAFKVEGHNDALQTPSQSRQGTTPPQRHQCNRTQGKMPVLGVGGASHKGRTPARGRLIKEHPSARGEPTEG